MPLTATKLPDGEMYLQEENPFSGKINKDDNHEYIQNRIANCEHFARAHPPILALFKCTEGQRFEDGEVELVDQFQGHKDWHTCQNITPEMAKENNWPTRRVYTLKSDKRGLDLDKLEKKVDDFIATQTAESYNKTFAEIDADKGGEVVEEDERIPDFIVGDTCFSYCNDDIHIYINGELEGVLDPDNINGLRQFLNQLPPNLPQP